MTPARLADGAPRPYANVSIRDWLERALCFGGSRRPVLRADANGVALHDGRRGDEFWSVQWPDVEEIVAFKVDAGVVDHLCLGFRVRDTGQVRVVVEDTPGWWELNDELARRFDVHFDRWFPAVAFPAFAENWSVLWRRGGSLGAASRCSPVRSGCRA